MASLELDGKPLEWVNKWKYLVVCVCNGTKFICSATETITKFYKSANSIFRVDGVCNDILLLGLIDSHCIPILSYGIEVIHIIDASERSYRRYRRYDTVREFKVHF